MPSIEDGLEELQPLLAKTPAPGRRLRAAWVLEALAKVRERWPDVVMLMVGAQISMVVDGILYSNPVFQGEISQVSNQN